MSIVGTAPRPGRAVRTPRRSRALVGALALGLGLAVLAVIASIGVGARAIEPSSVVAILLGTAPPGVETSIVQGSRLPRTVTALVAGAALGVAGALVQALTRNPLADPGVLGITPGSAFAVAIGVGLLGLTDPAGRLWLAFGGAFVALLVVTLIGAAGGGSDPIRITLAGVALGAVLAGITSGIVLTDPQRFQAMRAWESGSLQDRGWEAIPVTLPFVAAGLVGALLLARPLNAVALGDDAAASLGTRVGGVRAGSLLAITVLSGGATALAGPIVFVGLMVPHLARAVVGPDQPRIVLLSMLFGPVLLLTADVIGRVAAPPGEIPAGLVTAVVGAPVLIALVRRRRVGTL